MRLNPQFAGLFRTAAKDCTISQGDGLPDLHFKAGDVIFGSFKNAHLNVSSTIFSLYHIMKTKYLILPQ